MQLENIQLITLSVLRQLTFEIPERNVNSRKRTHENRASTVETMAPEGLPDIFDFTNGMD